MEKFQQKLSNLFSPDVLGLSLFLFLMVLGFSLTTPRFFTLANFHSIAFQLPVLGLLTLAMLVPIISGGLNLAITFTANFSGLTLAWFLHTFGGNENSAGVFIFGLLTALALGALIGWIMGATIAYIGAHPILVSLAMMIFVRGLGEFLTRGGDISGFPEFVQKIGHGSFLGIPIPLLIFLTMLAGWHLLLSRSRHGFAVYMVGSNIEATRYSGLHTKRTLTLLYTLSGTMSAIAGIVMLARFNSVRVGHGEALLLVTVLACFLGGVDPFGGFGRVLPVFLALVILQVLSSALNLLNANQHLSTAVWGLFLIAVMVLRYAWHRFNYGHGGRNP